MKKLLLLAGVAIAVMTANAAPVSRQQAQNIAAQFAQNATMRMTSATTLTLAHEAKGEAGLTDYYVFNRAGETGWVVVSGDDRAVPVIAYGDRGAWDNNDLPQSVEWWMQQYRQQMQVLREHPEAARTARDFASSVEPLMTTTWKQSAPYNEEIPSTRFSLGTRRPMVGCVALAMAQMMKAHNWPTTGEGSHSYTWATTYQGEAVNTNYSANFGATTYQWSSMKNSYGSSAAATAVATLCYHCGVAVDMEYGVEASGAQITAAAQALRDYFRYDKSLDLYLRDFYDPEVWDDMLRADLNEGLPIIYGGSTQATNYAAPTGHCFVLDGYDTTGKFHINWGWGGDYDGYFATGLLDSGRYNCDFSNWQQAILGARPDRDGTSTAVERPLMGYMIDFSTAVTQATVGSDVAVAMDGVTFLGDGAITTSWWGVNILSEDESSVVDAQYFVNADGIVTGGTYSADDGAAFTVPATIADGTYHVRAMYSLDEDQTCHYFVRPETGSKYIKMVVTSGIAYFSEGGSDNPITPDPEYQKGDVNGDGRVDVTDINIIVAILLGQDDSANYDGRANVDGVGGIDISDINALIAVMLGL